MNKNNKITIVVLAAIMVIIAAWYLYTGKASNASPNGGNNNTGGGNNNTGDNGGGDGLSGDTGIGGGNDTGNNNNNNNGGNINLTFTIEASDTVVQRGDAIRITGNIGVSGNKNLIAYFGDKKLTKNGMQTWVSSSTGAIDIYLTMMNSWEYGTFPLQLVTDTTPAFTSNTLNITIQPPVPVETDALAEARYWFNNTTANGSGYASAANPMFPNENINVSGAMTYKQAIAKNEDNMLNNPDSMHSFVRNLNGLYNARRSYYKSLLANKVSGDTYNAWLERYDRLNPIPSVYTNNTDDLFGNVIGANTPYIVWNATQNGYYSVGVGNWHVNLSDNGGPYNWIPAWNLPSGSPVTMANLLG